MSKKVVTEDTIITIGKSIPWGAYEKFFRETTGKELFPVFHYWLGTQAGKTLKEALALYDEAARPKNMEESLSEKRFDNMSGADKAFIVAFDKELEALGYDYGGYIGGGYGGDWGKYAISYGKTGTKSRPCPARIYIKDDGSIILRLYLTKVDKHMQYIENAPAYIKNAFFFEGGDCKSCNTACAPGKTYTIDGQLMQKCNHSTFYYYSPTADMLPHIIELLTKFYPVKKVKAEK